MRDYSASWPWVIALCAFGLVSMPFVTSSSSHPEKNVSPKKTDATQPPVTGQPVAGDDLEHPLRPYYEHFGMSLKLDKDTPVLSAALKKRLAKTGQRFLIALVPDPTDGQWGADFDAYMEAIHRAVEQSGYVLDRSWLPWKKSGTTKARAEGRKVEQRLSEVQPGTLLFRPADLDSTEPLLTVFVVGDKPTSGIRKVAFHEAVQYARTLPNPKPEATLKIVGPVFSGSAKSFQAALEGLMEDAEWHKGLKKVRIISGSAMAINSKAFADQSANAVRRVVTVEYQTTVISNEALYKKFIHEFARGEKVVVLKESSTGYGQSVNNKDLLEIPFPMHISHTLTAISQDQARRDEARGLPTTSKNLPFPIETDLDEQAGAQSPAMTNVQNDLVLSSILATIARERVHYVWLHATDARDKLFLASMIREHCPEVRLFTVGSHILLAHPDYAYAMRGTFVVSTYPLHPTLQRWSSPYRGEEKRLLFSQNGTQGTYNAVLAQLGKEDLMIGYAEPSVARDVGAVRRTQPAIWVSVVTPTGRLVPFDYFPLEEQNANLVERTTVKDQPPPAVLVRYDSLWASAVLLASLGLVALGLRALKDCLQAPVADDRLLLLGCLFWPRQAVAIKPATAAAHGFAAVDYSKQLLATVSCFAAVVALYGLLGHLCLIHIGLNADSPWHPTDGIQYTFLNVVLPALVFLIALMASVCLLVAPWKRVLLKKGQRWHRQFISPFSFGSRCGYYVLVAVYLVLVWALMLRPLWHTDVRSALLFERSVDLSSGLTLVLPTFFLCLGVFAWGGFQLKGIRLLGLHSVLNPFNHAHAADKAGIRAQIQAAHQAINRALTDNDTRWYSPLRSYSLLYVLILLATLRFWTQALPTLEGNFIDWAFLAGFVLLALMVGVSFVDFLRLWREVQEILKRLNMMPLARAFANLPHEVAGMFPGYLYTRRPHQSHFHFPIRQFTLLRRGWRQGQKPTLRERLEKLLTDPNTAPAPETTRLLDRLDAAFHDDLAAQYEADLHPPADADDREDATVGTSLQNLRDATAAMMTLLLEIWKRYPLEEITKTSDDAKKPANPPAPAPQDADLWEWVRLAETLVATQAVLYVSQFFVQLRNLLMAVTVGTLCLLLAATSYPFEPQSQLVVYLLVLVGIVSYGAVRVFVQINRNPFISRLSNTTPDKFTPDLGFLSSFATYVLPLFGVLAVQLSGTFRIWLEPIFRTLR